MAYIETFICRTCLKNVQGAIGSGQTTPTQCHSCKSKESDDKRAQFLKGLEALTIEERLKKVEAWIYDYKVPINPIDIRF